MSRTGISRNNYEVFFLDYLEGKLSEEELGMLRTFLEFNPDLAVELEGMEQMRLQPERIVFMEKEFGLQQMGKNTKAILKTENVMEKARLLRRMV